MATGKALNGKPHAGNPHVRFDEGGVVPSATPRRGSLLYKNVEALRSARGAMLALFASFSFVGALHGANYTYTWTWNGNGDGVTWTNGSNWTCSPAGAAYEYPSTVEDIAKFNSKVGGGLVVTSRLDKAVTLYGIMQSGSDPVVLTTTNNSSLAFGLRSGAVVAIDYDGIVAKAGTTLYLDVPIVMNQRFDRWGDGTVVWSHSISNGLDKTGTYMSNFFGGNGTNIFTGDFTFLANASSAYSFGYGGKPGRWAYSIQQDNASFSTKELKVGNSRSCPNAVWRQDGDATITSVTNLYVGNNTDTDDWSTSVYHMVRGTLSASSKLNLGNGRPGYFVQDGGTATVAMVECGTGARSYGGLEVRGGRFVMNGTMDFGKEGRFDFIHSGGTFVVPVALTLNDTVKLSGSPTLEVASGKSLTLRRSPQIAAGTSLTKTGAGKVYIQADVPARGSLTVAEGEIAIGNGGAYTDRMGILGAYDDYEPWQVTIKNGASLGWQSSGYSITAYYYKPMDLNIEDGGRFYFHNHRTAAFAHSLVTNGVALPRGTYTTAPNSPLYSTSEKGLSHMIVPYTWTGGGDGTTWTDPLNWEDGAVPPNNATGSESGVFADLSRATNITFSANIAIGGILYAPCGANRRLVISSQTASFKLDRASYHTSCMVVPDATLEFDCKVLRRATVSMVGNGTFVFDRYVLGSTLAASGFNNNYMPIFCIDGTVIYRNATEFTRFDESSSYRRAVAWHANQSGSEARIIFEGEDTDLEYDLFMWSRGGYSSANWVYQRGGANITVSNFCMNTCRNDGQKPQRYYLQDGTLTCVEGIYLNKNVADGVSCCQNYPGGDFEMTGGTLTTPLMGSECLQNWYYLNGGDLYIGAGGIVRTCDTRNYAPTDSKTKGAYDATTGLPLYNTTPSLQLGGVRLHATADFSVSLDTAFSGKGGATTIDTAGHDITFEGCVLTGTGGWRKIGEGTLYLNGTNSFTGAMSVEAGTVSIGAGAVNEAVPARIELASASSLSLPAGAAWTVETLIVGGVRKTAGESVTFGEGSVTVAQPATLAAGRWIGPAAGGDWLATSNWSDGVIPNGKTASADLKGTSLADGARITFASDIVLGGLDVDVPGTITLAATDGACILLTNATVTVSPETTLVFDSPVVVGASKNGNSPVYVAGGGRVVFAKEVLDQVGASSKHRMMVDDGTVAEFRDQLQGVTLEARSAHWQTSWADIIVAEGGDLNLANSVLAGGAVRMTQTGGKVAVTNSFVLAGACSTQTRCYHTLDSGELLVANGCTLGGGWTGDMRLYLNGGVIKTSGQGTAFKSDLLVTLGGAVTFTQADAKTDSRFDNDFYGEGSITQAGPGRATFTGIQSAVTSYTVLGGTLAIQGAAAATNLTVTAGTLSVGGAAAATIPPTASLSLRRTGKLNLDFDGELVVRKLRVGSYSMAAGIYDDGTRYTTPLSQYITGPGVLRVLEGHGPGLHLFVR